MLSSKCPFKLPKSPNLGEISKLVWNKNIIIVKSIFNLVCVPNFDPIDALKLFLKQNISDEIGFFLKKLDLSLDYVGCVENWVLKLGRLLSYTL